MKRAFYYPEWSLNDPVALGRFLIYWDKLNFITPKADWKWRNLGGYDDDTNAALHEAHEEFGMAYEPSEANRKSCDALVRRIFDPVAHRALDFGGSLRRSKMEVTLDRRKFDEATIKFLEKNKLLSRASENVCDVSEAAANIVMAAMAHSCSSELLPTTTVDNHRSQLHLKLIDSALDPGKEEGGNDEPDQDPVSIVQAVVDVPKAKNEDPRFLRQVLHARKKDDVNGQRKLFQDEITKYCDSLKNANGEADLKNIEDHFKGRLEEERNNLLRELRAAGCDAAFSKEGIITLATSAFLGGGLGGPAGAIALALGSLFVLRSYRKKRKEVMRKNWTSWLYEVENPGMPVL